MCILAVYTTSEYGLSGYLCHLKESLVRVKGDDDVMIECKVVPSHVLSLEGSKLAKFKGIT